ncbi:MAG: DUF814 domain-containing protein [Bdellovibrionales bacterium]|nr:DUF814 domain-containing protein [Bdellovibrionales bacterium]
MKLAILNWKEWARLVQTIRQAFSHGNWHVDKVIVPENQTHLSHYRKSEWCIRLTSRKDEAYIQFRIRPQGNYLFADLGKGPKACASATQSPFGLAMAKHLKSRKWLGIEVPEQERVITVWFSGDGRDDKIGLRLSMIPALPEALLISDRGQILADSRAHKRESQAPKKAPTKSEGPRKVPDAEIRYPEELSNLKLWADHVQKALVEEDLEDRKNAAERSLKAMLSEIEKRIRQAQKTLDEASAEPDWSAEGEALKGKILSVGENLDSKEMDRLFQKAKRKKRRLEESQSQIQFLKKRAEQLARLKDFEEIEKALGAGLRTTPQGTESKSKPSKNQWMGRSYISKEGLGIWVGKSRDENLELTFKHARGNDLWMHVRGRPGAHVLIPLHSGKSASLETLLDAAQLCIFHSGGENWGTTEVDYTFKKHVKRIKDSTEASYTHNKTLLVKPDPERLKRLLGASTPALATKPKGHR